MSDPKTDDHDAISRRAYDLWHAEGQPHGRDRDHWEQAAREIAGTDAESSPEPSLAEVSSAQASPSESLQPEPPAEPGAESATLPATSGPNAGAITADAPAIALSQSTPAPAKAKAAAKPRKPRAK